MNKTFAKYFVAYIAFVFCAGFFGLELTVLSFIFGLATVFYVDVLRGVFKK
jgi:hypothetical protein